MVPTRTALTRSLSAHCRDHSGYPALIEKASSPVFRQAGAERQNTVLNLGSVRALYNAGKTPFLSVLCRHSSHTDRAQQRRHLDHHDLAMTHLIML